MEFEQRKPSLKKVNKSTTCGYQCSAVAVFSPKIPSQKTGIILVKMHLELSPLIVHISPFDGEHIF